jgi:hypothetical protein
MSKITAIASSLGGNVPTDSSPSEQIEPKSEPIQQTSPILRETYPQPDPRIALLNSVKPLLREEKRGRVDSLLNALTVASLLKGFKK